MNEAVSRVSQRAQELRRDFDRAFAELGRPRLAARSGVLTLGV